MSTTSIQKLTLPANKKRNPLVVEVDKMIGSGAFGQVWKIKYNGKDAALKIVKNIDPKLKDSIESEVKMLNSISEKYPGCDENILCYFDISQDAENIYFVSELLDIDYFDAIVNDKYCNSSNGEKLEYVYLSLRQMLNGLKTLHAMGILHRDIKPENFLVRLSDQTIKIADFGFSCFEKNLENICKGRLGTPAFVAPHIYLDENDPIWSVMDDLYALANVVYAGLTCISFMDNDYIKELVQDYYNGNLSKEDILDFYENNYRNKIKDLYNQYQEQKLSTKQKQIFNFFWNFLGILDPKNKKLYSADGLLNTM